MNKYEISIWEDFPDTSSGVSFLNERKIAIIGSDIMREQNIQWRALEPNLVEDINGTHTFTFKMYYTYLDTITGERLENPFIRYLVNERKVKVKWQDEWYDLVVKKCQEDTSSKSITYTCTDIFINELSKQGYSLEFDTELQNNIGTAKELAEQVLDGSTWQYDESASEPIIQKTEGPVYEIYTSRAFTATKEPSNINITIPKNKKILVFYDSIININNGDIADVQFLYSADGYQTDINDDLVINGDCYTANMTWTRTSSNLIGKIQGNVCININLESGVSINYRAARLVRSQLTRYDPILQRYVNVCIDPSNSTKEIYEVATTEYSNPIIVKNLVANPTEFTNVSGWVGDAVQSFQVLPEFNNESDIETYEAKSFLYISTGVKTGTASKDIYNTGIQSNISYFQPTDSEIQQGIIGGIQKGEKYIFRIQFHNTTTNILTRTAVRNNQSIRLNLYKYNKTTYKKTGAALFDCSRYTAEDSSPSLKEGWNEFELIANKTVSAEEIQDYGLFITINNFTTTTSAGTSTTYYRYWIQDIQFFKYAEGIKSDDNGDLTAEVSRINPGDFSLQSYAQPIYKYYKPADSLETLKYLYVGSKRYGDSLQYKPKYNNYEKIGTINEKESNRFNILQSIAETFQAWVKFRIDHNSNGATKFIKGIPQKFVYFVPEIGQETGISFEYGIDLKTIRRTLDSDQLATKIIVLNNSNEFGKNGFCSIARSIENPTRENFIINLNYYTQQNLIDAEELAKDLYSAGGINYYNSLYNWNTEYDNLTEELNVKQIDLVRQEAQKEVYDQYILSAKQEVENIESDVMRLAGVETWKAAQNYARAHSDNEKIQSLLNSRAQLKNSISENQAEKANINSSISTLKKRIKVITNRQNTLLNSIRQKHQKFNDKYGLYLLEGTWQDEDYVDDNKYYLDALNVAYTSSRPQLSYTINVMRLSSLEEYSSKVFRLGDICYMQDREFFGYLKDKITPYKEKILVSKVSSFFDQPEKDILTIQNYKTRFDDLFQRIAATTQSLSYSQGSFTNAAETFNTNGTLKFDALQNTFDENYNLVLNSSNQDVSWDNTGITVKNKANSADQTKIIAGGIFVTNDGGNTWKNAIRGDGISADVVTTGRLNTGEVYIYNGDTPYFRWDKDGISAYAIEGGQAIFNKFVRHDKFGFYGYDGNKDFVPSTEQQIWDNARFGMTWKGFFLKGGSNNGPSMTISNDAGAISFKIGKYDQTNGGLNIEVNNTETIFQLKGSKDGGSLTITSDKNGTSFILSRTDSGKGSIEISSANDIVVTDTNNYKRVKIGKIDNTNGYGIRIRDAENKLVFQADGSGTQIAGWTINNNSVYKTVGGNTIGLFSNPTNTTINGHTDKYYILAGNQFGVTANGEIYSKAGQIGGWEITDTELIAKDSTNNTYTKINSGGTLSGKGTKNGYSFTWSIGANGFNFSSPTEGSGNDFPTQIVLGPTTINNQYIYTKNISASGGSIGGCSISGGGISGGGWNLGSNGLSLNGSLLNTYITPVVLSVNAWLNSSATTTITKTITWAEGATSATFSFDVPKYTLQGTVSGVKFTALRSGTGAQFWTESIGGAPTPV